MPASSVIFLVILLICAGSLVPSAIRRRRHTEQSRIADRDSAALRVVVRGGPGGYGAVTTPALTGSSSRPVLGSGTVAGQRTAVTRALPVGSPALSTAPAPVAAPRASRVVARRRRLVLTVLVVAVVGWVAVVAGAPVVLGGLATAPVVVVVAALTRHGASVPVRTAPAVRVVVQAPRDVETTVELPVVSAPAVPVQRSEPARTAAPAAAAGSWAPVPVPLPTYLLKSKAPDRTAAVQRPTVELVVFDESPEVVDLRQPVRAVNE